MLPSQRASYGSVFQVSHNRPALETSGNTHNEAYGSNTLYYHIDKDASNSDFVHSRTLVQSTLAEDSEGATTLLKEEIRRVKDSQPDAFDSPSILETCQTIESKISAAYPHWRPVRVSCRASLTDLDKITTEVQKGADVVFAIGRSRTRISNPRGIGLSPRSNETDELQGNYSGLGTYMVPPGPEEPKSLFETRSLALPVLTDTFKSVLERCTLADDEPTVATGPHDQRIPVRLAWECIPKPPWSAIVTVEEQSLRDLVTLGNPFPSGSATVARRTSTQHDKAEDPLRTNAASPTVDFAARFDRVVYTVHDRPKGKDPVIRVYRDDGRPLDGSAPESILEQEVTDILRTTYRDLQDAHTRGFRPDGASVMRQAARRLENYLGATEHPKTGFAKYPCVCVPVCEKTMDQYEVFRQRSETNATNGIIRGVYVRPYSDGQHSDLRTRNGEDVCSQATLVHMNRSRVYVCPKHNFASDGSVLVYNTEREQGLARMQEAYSSLCDYVTEWEQGYSDWEDCRSAWEDDEKSRNVWPAPLSRYLPKASGRFSGFITVDMNDEAMRELDDLFLPVRSAPSGSAGQVEGSIRVI